MSWGKEYYYLYHHINLCYLEKKSFEHFLKLEEEINAFRKHPTTGRDIICNS